MIAFFVTRGMTLSAMRFVLTPAPQSSRTFALNSSLCFWLAYPLATSPQATEQWTESELAFRRPPQIGHFGRAASALAVLANPLHRREQ
jgi:hypothetical protein